MSTTCICPQMTPRPPHPIIVVALLHLPPFYQPRRLGHPPTHRRTEPSLLRQTQTSTRLFFLPPVLRSPPIHPPFLSTHRCRVTARSIIRNQLRSPRPHLLRPVMEVRPNRIRHRNRRFSQGLLSLCSYPEIERPRSCFRSMATGSAVSRSCSLWNPLSTPFVSRLGHKSTPIKSSI